MKIYYNSTRQIKNIISSGVFGPLKKVSIAEGGVRGKTGRSKNSYQSDPKLSGGGMLMETSCHTFSQLAFLFNNISVREAKVVWVDDFDVESNVILDVCDNVPFSIDYTGTMLKLIENNATFFFEHNKIQFDHRKPNAIFTISSFDSEKQFIIEQEDHFASTFAQAYYLKWKDFLNQMSKGSAIDTEFETSIKTTKMITDIMQKGNRK
jgi:predicted dehydrogenase